jgi:hypothetical protein
MIWGVATDRAGYSAAYTYWCERGGDKGLFHALWPLIAGRVRPPKPSERFTRAGRCRDCEIRAGKGYLTPGLNRAGRCASCQRHFDKFGPPLAEDVE